MSIDRADIARLLGELVGAIERSKLDAVHARDEDSVVLKLRSPDRERLFLLLSARARFARFHLVGRGSWAARVRTPFAAALESSLAGARLEAARQVAGDRVVEFVFAVRGRAGGERYRLVHEIRESPGNLVLVDASGAIVARLRPVRRGPEELRPGDRYEFPPRPERTPADPGTVAPPGEADEVPEAFAKHPFHFKLASEYERREREAELAERKAEALDGLRRGVRRRARALGAARADLAATAGAEDLLQRGELLKASLHRLRRGMASAELEDFFRGGGETVRIDLDPELGPRENMERYFRRYRKLARARPALERRIADLEEDLRRLREAEERAERA
ncbi:MAG: NFACT family protein, partial [Planctomycetota bacterium]